MAVMACNRHMTLNVFGYRAIRYVLMVCKRRRYLTPFPKYSHCYVTACVLLK